MSILNTLFNTAAAMAINPKIVHSLPGRLRLHIAALRMVPEQWRMAPSAVSRVLASLPSIRDVTWNYITGNVLIEYDSETISEQTVIEAIKRAGRFIVDRRERLQVQDPDSLPQSMEELCLQFIEENEQEVLKHHANTS
jgi:hypothetical protein